MAVFQPGVFQSDVFQTGVLGWVNVEGPTQTWTNIEGPETQGSQDGLGWGEGPWGSMPWGGGDSVVGSDGWTNIEEDDNVWVNA
jgi:hypothetical protein